MQQRRRDHHIKPMQVNAPAMQTKTVISKRRNSRWDTISIEPSAKGLGAQVKTYAETVNQNCRHA